MNCCRLCAILSSDAVSIYGEEGIEMELAYKINKHLPIMVSETNKLPLNVCRKCIAQLDAIVNFMSNCIKAQYRIEKMLQDLDGVISDCLSDVKPKKKIDVFNSVIYANFRSKPSSECGEEVNFSADETQRRRTDLPSTVGSMDVSIQAKGDERVRLSRRPSNRTFKTNVSKSRSVRDIPLVELSDGEDAVGNVEGDNAGKTTEPQNEADTRSDMAANRATDEGSHVADDYPRQESKTQRECFCQYCKACFKWKAELFRHQTSAHPDSVFRCSQCLKVFYDRKEDLLKHEKAHRTAFAKNRERDRSPRPPTPAKPNDTALAGGSENAVKAKRRRREGMLFGGDPRETKGGVEDSPGEKVVDAEEPEGPRRCRSCDPCFVSEEERDQHRKANHVLRLPCRFCPRTLVHEKELEQHEASHFSENRHKCRKCGKSFATAKELTKHRSTHYESPRYDCESCEKSFRYKFQLLKHVAIHSDERRFFLCEKCGKFFKTGENLGMHQRFECGNTQAAKKHACEKSFFFSEARLREHIRGHTGGKPFACSACEKCFHSASLLRQHALKHSHLKHPCPSCGILFSHKSSVTSHSKKHKCWEGGKTAPEIDDHPEGGGELPASKERGAVNRSEERQYECSACSKRLLYEATLKKHLEMHSGGPPYRCRHCDQTFVLYRSMVEHEEAHSIAKAHSCGQCGKSYRTPIGLSNHRTSHSAENQFPCDVCHNTFARKVSLLIHKRKHAPKRPYACSSCPRTFSQARLALGHERTHLQEREGAVIVHNVTGRDSCAPDLSHTIGESSSSPVNVEDIAGEVLVYDSQSLDSHYSEIIIVSEEMNEIVVDGVEDL